MFTIVYPDLAGAPRLRRFSSATTFHFFARLKKNPLVSHACQSSRNEYRHIQYLILNIILNNLLFIFIIHTLYHIPTYTIHVSELILRVIQIIKYVQLCAVVELRQTDVQRHPERRKRNSKWVCVYETGTLFDARA